MYNDDDDQGPPPEPVEYHPDRALLCHAVYGVVVGLIFLLIPIWWPSPWLFRFGEVVSALSGFLCLLWLCLFIAKKIWPQAVRTEPIFRKGIIESGESNPDNWLFGLGFTTILVYILRCSWYWLLHYRIFLLFIGSLITGLILYIVLDRVSYVFGRSKK